MRWVIGLLVVANLAVFAWWQGWVERPQPVPREVGRDRVKVVPIERLEGTPGGSLPAAVPGTPGEPSVR
jgi:hypothetical protein